MEIDKEKFLKLLINTTEEQQEALNIAIKKLELQNLQLNNSIIGVQKTIQDSIIQSLNDTTKAEISGTINPILQGLSRELEKTTDKAIDEKNQLKRAQALLSWKWILFASFTSISVTALLVFGVYSAVWWQRHELESMRADVAEMEKNVARLEKLNGRIHLETCDNKPCIEVDTKRSFSDEGADSRYKFFWLRTR